MLELHCSRRKKTAYIRNRKGAEKNERIGFRVADGVWQGQKSLEQVTELIDNRVQLYLNEE